MKIRLTENQFKRLVKRIAKKVINETRLDYDEDNFSGTQSRGARYDICSDGDCIYHDVPEEVVDRLADEVERKYGSVDVQEIGGDEGYDDEGYDDVEYDDEEYDEDL